MAFDLENFGIGAVVGVAATGLVVGAIKAYEYFSSPKGEEKIKEAKEQASKIMADLETRMERAKAKICKDREQGSESQQVEPAPAQS